MSNLFFIEEQIAAICSGVLDQADVDYAKVFIINGNEKSSLDIIYDLKNQQELLNELTTYFKRKKHYTLSQTHSNFQFQLIFPLIH